MNGEDIKVDVIEHPEGGGKRAAVISDTRAGRAWSGEGNTDSEAVTQATRKFLGDRRAREYVG